jgi:hypothetical protein
VTLGEFCGRIRITSFSSGFGIRVKSDSWSCGNSRVASTYERYEVTFFELHSWCAKGEPARLAPSAW